MGVSSSSSAIHLSLIFTLLLLSISWPSSASSSVHDNLENFIRCIHLHNKPPNQLPIYTRTNSSYSLLLESSARNLRYLSPTFRKPELIVTPFFESHIQATVICSRKHQLDIKVRSGGHDIEGQSFISDVPFILVDMVKFRSIDVDVENRTAWVQAGATVGEVYYKIGEMSKTLGFPAGFAFTVGVGGHLSGGGLGALVRKYGLSADQVLDARIVNVNGDILNKETMGEDLFWAIRGGGASSFGVILSWKIYLVPVPPIVTIASVSKTLKQGAIDLVHKWQFIADKLHKDLYLAVALRKDNDIAQATFFVLFLGDIEKLLPLMKDSFLELGLQHEHCKEFSWVESHINFFFATGQPLEQLLDRNAPGSTSFWKAKSDNVMEPIPKNGLKGLWKRLLEEDAPNLLLTPYGGRMNEISESEIPFPHRVGNIYNILYLVGWLNETESEKHLDWIRKLYEYMTPYVSKFPRTAYLNYKDLDLGQFENGDISYSKAREWGTKYFKRNFDRLVKVKTMVDPDNFFKNQQSIPPINA